MEKLGKQMERLSRQMDSLASGQSVVESIVRKMYEDLGSARTARAPAASRYRMNSMKEEYFDPTGSSAEVYSTPKSAAGKRSRQENPSESEVERAKSHKDRELNGGRVAGKSGLMMQVSSSKSSKSVQFVGTAPSDLGFWLREELREPKARMTHKFNTNGTVMGIAQGSSVNSGYAMGQRRKCCRTVHPDCRLRGLFDFVSIIALSYDSLLIPYRLAWTLPNFGLWMALSWITACFWIADLVMGFLTGYYKRDKVVMSYRAIAWHYLRTGFFPKMLLVVADLLGNTLESIGNHNVDSGYLMLLAFIRLLRVFSLSSRVRNGKLVQLSDRMTTVLRRWGLHEHYAFTTSVCRWVLFLMWTNHVGGCLWHAIGKSARVAWQIEKQLAEQGTAFEYLLGFSWSARTMIGADSFMTPTTIQELVLILLFVVLGFIFTSVLISSLLTTVIEYQAANREKYEKLKTLRQFLYQHSVDSQVATPVVKQVTERLGRSSRISEGDVAALSFLSPVTRSELWCCIYGPSILDNPFICACNTVEEGLVKDICLQALEIGMPKPGDRIFEPDEEAVGASYIYWGSLDYVPVFAHRGASEEWPSMLGGAEAQEVQEWPEPQIAGQGAWLSTVALFAHWLHRGWLDASGPCELLTVKAQPLTSLLVANPDLKRLIRSYGTWWLSALQQELPESITDLHLPVTHQSIVVALPQDMRSLLSRKALKAGAHNSGRLFNAPPQTGTQALQEEIDRGECDVMVNASGQVKRVVSVAALRLRREDGTLLVELSKCDDGVWSGNCRFPGTKVRAGEYPKLAIQRMIKEQFGDMAHGITLFGSSLDVKDAVSQRMGLNSTYLRTLFEATLFEEVEEDYLKVLTRTPRPISEGNHWQSSEDSATSCDAFVFRQELASGSLTAYAWMVPEDFGRLCQPGGRQLLDAWLSELCLEGVWDLGEEAWQEQDEVASL